jgi:predicted dehydrogenase
VSSRPRGCGTRRFCVGTRRFAAVWGRNLAAAAELAAGYGARPHDDIEAFPADVDGVAFAVPPDVQAPIATRAARAGKHLLLEKPIAVCHAEADALVEAAEASQVATVVFFTLRFSPDIRRDKGARWDIAPHGISVLWAGLGPVTSVTADAGRGPP